MEHIHNYKKITPSNNDISAGFWIGGNVYTFRTIEVALKIRKAADVFQCTECGLMITRCPYCSNEHVFSHKETCVKCGECGKKYYTTY